MNARLLEYLLREVQEAVRIMQRDSTRLHVFDVGKGGGEDLVMLMAILPRHVADQILPPEMLKPSVPANASDPARSASPEGKP